jgi:hypothetical protein
MYQRDLDRRTDPGRPRPAPPPRNAGLLALQRAIGNRGTMRLLARKGGKNAANFERSVKVGTLGPIEIKGGNVDDWVAKKNPEDLVLTTTKGKHSDALKRMAGSKDKIDTVQVQVIVGQNTFVVITFSHARIKGYAADDGKTEQWKVVDFDAVHTDRTAIGAARP